MIALERLKADSIKGTTNTAKNTGSNTGFTFNKHAENFSLASQNVFQPAVVGTRLSTIKADEMVVPQSVSNRSDTVKHNEESDDDSSNDSMDSNALVMLEEQNEDLLQMLHLLT